MDILRIYLEEQLLINYWFIKHLNPKYNRYQCLLASMVYKFLHKKSLSAYTSGGAIKSRIIMEPPVSRRFSQANYYKM